MLRIIFGAITSIIVSAAFIFLWLINPLYAFVGGVVFVVFVAVGFAFLINLPKSEQASSEQVDVQPRRTGQFRQPRSNEKPEDSWEREDSTQEITTVLGDNKKRDKAASAPPQAQPSPKPDISLSDRQDFGAVPVPTPQAPPEPESTATETPIDWLESLANQQDKEKGRTTDVDIEIEEGDNDWADIQDSQADEKPVGRAESPTLVDENQKEGDGLHTINIENTDTFEAVDDLEALESDYDFDEVAADIKRKIDSGRFGDSAEEVEEFFKMAFDRAANNDESTPDYLDEDSDDVYFDEEDLDEEIPNWLDNKIEDTDKDIAWLASLPDEEVASNELAFGDEVLDLEEAGEGSSELMWLEGNEEEPITEIPDWLQASMEEDHAGMDEGIFDEELDLGEEWEDTSKVITSKDENLVQTGADKSDLMGMVGSLPPEKQQEFFRLMTEVPIDAQRATQLMRLYEKLVDNKEPADIADEKKISEAQFTAYYPRQAAVDTEYGFYVYAHLPNALIEADIQQFQQELGGRVPKPKVAQEAAKIEEGATLAVMIQCDALDFNQVGAMQEWQSPFVRFDFKFTADERLVDEIVTGRIAILLGMIEIASIDFQLAVIPSNPLAMVTAIPHNPLTAHNFESSATASLYQKIFVSYSRKDTLIAEHYRKAQMMAGNIIFMDTHSIRAGEDWEVALKRFIDEADVFQLFWSEHSAESDHVRFEWDYALTQRCPDTRCVRFIRPAYWQKPLADIPNELNHLHFAFVEMEGN